MPVRPHRVPRQGSAGNGYDVVRMGGPVGFVAHGTTAGFALASGMASSMHGDFMNAWQPAAQAARVRNCIDQSVKCNSAGNN